jgi:hypothetical protein
MTTVPRSLTLLAAASLLLGACGADAGHGHAAHTIAHTYGDTPSGSDAAPTGAPGAGISPASGLLDPSGLNGVGSSSSSGGQSTTSSGTPRESPSSPPTLPTGSHTPPSQPPPGTGTCPDPRYCPDYTLGGGSWPIDGSGHAVIHYRINPSKYTGGWNDRYPMSTDQIVGAITAAAQAWMAADPVVELMYDGTTTADPATPTGGNYNSVVGFYSSPSVNCADGLACADVPSNTSTYSSFDIEIAGNNPFAWSPCDPANSHPCTDGPTSGPYDLEDLVVHEWGHVLGLNHPNLGQKVDDSELTMWSPTNLGERHKDTLGLGDILGLRHLYPTSAAIPVVNEP